MDFVCARIRCVCAACVCVCVVSVSGCVLYLYVCVCVLSVCVYEYMNRRYQLIYRNVTIHSSLLQLVGVCSLWVSVAACGCVLQLVGVFSAITRLGDSTVLGSRSST
eukprot:GHVQ01034853.1.p1 GENE.GHVQ01034853.1~~GHVQ01034853.1.p1  ORF type:complete len:107 (+),score=15.63 GHVQ01034853.1:117-437(+)